MDAISDLLSTPLVRSILEVHPNDLALNFVPGNFNDNGNENNMIHPSWQSWWDWAAGSVNTRMRTTSTHSKARWVDLVHYYITGSVDGIVGDVKQVSTEPCLQR